MRPDRQARLHAAVDRQAAEAVAIVPFAGGGYLVGASDPARPVREIPGVVKAVPKTVRAMGAGSGTGHNAELRTATHSVTITSALVPYAIGPGDRVVLRDQGDLELQVDHALPFGTGRTILMLKPV